MISPAGDVHELDPAKIDERSMKSGSQKYVSGQLTGVVPGCVIETEMIAADREPALGGRSVSIDVGGYYPTTTEHVTFSAPAALHLHIVERALPARVKPRHTVENGRETWAYVLGPVPAGSSETQVPSDVILFPRIAMTPTPSWASAAKAYRDALEPHLAFAYPTELPRGDTRDTALAITRWLTARAVHGGQHRR